MASELVNSTEAHPRVFGMDLLETEPLPGARVMQGDIFNQEDLASLLVLGNLKKGNLLMSDMAPNTSGDRDVDFLSISQLNLVTLASANKLLLPGGNFLMKTFVGKDEHNYFVSQKNKTLETLPDAF